MTLRETLTQAVLARIANVPALPPPVRGEDDPRTADYVPMGQTPGGASQFLSLLDEGCDARPGCSPVMGAGGVIYDWNLKLVASYSLRTSDPDLRKTQRDVAVANLTAALLPSQLGEIEQRQLGGLANWMWLQPVDLHNDVYDGDVQLGVARLPLTIWFSASDPSA